MGRDYEIKTTFSAQDRVSRKIDRIQSRLLRFTARASRALRKLDRISMRLAKGFGGILKRGAIGAAAGAAGLFYAINRTAQSMDDLAKKTRAMQFPIEEFQEYRFAAEQAGVGSEVFDKSLQKFTKTVGELKGGYGALYTALKKTDKGLLKQLKNTDDVDKAFELYLQAIEKTPGAMDKAALATAAFGRSGADMINMANLGSKEIANLRAQMRENGVVTEKQAAAAEKYNDMMNRVGLTVKSFFVEGLEPFLPMLTEAADSMRKWMVANREMIGTKITEFVKKIPYYIEQIVKWAPRVARYVEIFAKIVIGIKLAQAALWLFNKAALASATSMGKVGTASTAAMGKAQASTAAATRGVGGLGKAFGAIGALVAGLEIGKLIHDQIVDPLIKAQFEAAELSAEIADTMGRDLSNRRAAQMQRDVAKIGQKEKELDTNYIYSLPGMGAMADAQRLALNKEKRRFMRELDARKWESGEGSAGESNTAGYDWTAPIATQSVDTRTVKTEHKETTEIVIKDDTGRARIAKGNKGKNVKLMHTGAPA